jgi:aryl-alcohol dehydrogenase-like predicted oxidoreductase
MDGGSERLVGSVLRELIEAGELSRDEVIVVSKIGYVQGQNHALAAQREQDGKPFAEMVKIQDGMWHCIHPEFLEDQFQRSLDRLEIDTLDACLLHNPEYFLAVASAGGQPLVKARDEFYRRVSAAFEFFENQVAAGRLRWYGVSSNTLVSSPTAVDAVAVSRLIDAAGRAAGDENYFKVLQLPLNLYESGAVFEKNTGPGREQTALEAARAANLAVLANRPLNAFSGRTMLRLADVLVLDAAGGWEDQRDLVARLEEEFRNTVAPHVQAPSEGIAPSQYFGWAAQLSTIQAQQPSLEQWAQVEGQISYTVGRIAASLDETLADDVAERWAEWRGRYFRELNTLLRAMRAAAAEAAQARSEKISAQIDPLIAPERRDETLSRKALWTVASTPGVACVLNGMRTVEYVADALGVLEWESAREVEAIYRAFQEH